MLFNTLQASSVALIFSKSLVIASLVPDHLDLPQIDVFLWPTGYLSSINGMMSESGVAALRPISVTYRALVYVAVTVIATTHSS